MALSVCLLLDEPAAGMNPVETHEVTEQIARLRDDLGLTIFVIEHDMPFIMGITDRVYCLETGRVIAEGTPAALRDDAAVIASYLGTDRRAIQRSGTPDVASVTGKA